MTNESTTKTQRADKGFRRCVRLDDAIRDPQLGEDAGFIEYGPSFAVRTGKGKEISRLFARPDEGFAISFAT